MALIWGILTLSPSLLLLLLPPSPPPFARVGTPESRRAEEKKINCLSRVFVCAGFFTQKRVLCVWQTELAALFVVGFFFLQSYRFQTLNLGKLIEIIRRVTP